VPDASTKQTTKKKTVVSPFRYPGGKSWLRRFVRQWLNDPVDHLVECFAGGANVTLTAISEGLAKKATLIEIDPEVAAVWESVLNGQASWLSSKIETFRPGRRTVQAELKISPRTKHTTAWQTLLRNRVSHGGILAPGAGLLRRGEDDKGINSRWYPETLISRITEINNLRTKIRFIEGDGLAWMAKYKPKTASDSVAFFIDPPYSAVGERLYTYGIIDHEKLFRVASALPGRVLMAYHDASEIHKLAREFKFKYRRVDMLSRQHTAKTELLICKNFDWLKKQ
jgi:DNA adenine methylase